MQTTKGDKQRLYRVSVDVSEDIHHKIKSLEKSKQTTQSDVVRKAIHALHTLDEVVGTENRVVVVNKKGHKVSDCIFL